jgi:hypothetical protein
MKTLFVVVSCSLTFVGGGWVGSAQAQTPSRFNSIQLLTNREVALNLSNAPLRIEAAGTVGSWQPLVTLTPAASSISFTDTAAPYLLQRFYRAAAVSGRQIWPAIT